MEVVEIASGAIVNAPDLAREVGVVEVIHEGRHVTIFVQDLKAHSERLQAL